MCSSDLFIAAAFFHNSVSLPARLTEDIVLTSKLLLGTGLVALGASVRWNSIKKIGAKPMVMGLIAWVIVAGVALTAVRITGL